MNDLQTKEWELLKLFVDICERLHLTYYLVCGSALGAVKYGGFIPWDDDVDVGMPRKDYEIFLTEAPTLLPSWVFVQNSGSEPAFPQIYTKLRDSRTTYIESTVRHLDIHHGIYIDVFPLDAYPCGNRTLFEWKKRFLFGRLASFCDVKRSRRAKGLDILYRVFCGKLTASRVVSRCERWICRSRCDDTIWCNHGNWQGTREYAPAAQYGAGTWASFEGLTVRIPEKYDEYLTQKYGAWREDLPEEERVGHHLYTVMDTERPYDTYTERK